MTIWNLYDAAVAEVDANRENLINEAYILKLEAHIKELETARANPTTVTTFINVLNETSALDGLNISKIKLLRAAFNLSLKEANDALQVHTAPTSRPYRLDDTDLPF